MGIELALVILGVTLVGGMFVAVMVNGADILADRDAPAQEEPLEQTSGFYEDSRDKVASNEATVTHIEHYLRKERIRAQRFADDPSAENLRTGEYESVWKRASN
jgi:hypothetical protein